MSYILDALRKADAQRESGSSRGIHAHPTPLGESDSSSTRPVWWWGVGAVVVALISWGGWSLVKDKDVPAPTAAPVVASAPSAAAPRAVAVATTPPPAPAAAIEPPPPATEVVAPPPGMHVPQPRQTAQGPGMSVPPMTPPAQAPARVAPPPAAATAAGSAPVSTVSGLPPDAPRVSISGGVYSPNPVQRMLIVNGQVFNEGSEVAPGLAIDEIKPRTAILKFRGARYTVTY